MKIQIEKPMLKSLAMMASVIEARDAYTGGHLWRVSQYSQRLAEAAGLPAEMVFLSRLGGFLHDIGKIGIPDGILGKRGKLSEPEYEVVKTHPGIGAALIRDASSGQPGALGRSINTTSGSTAMATRSSPGRSDIHLCTNRQHRRCFRRPHEHTPLPPGGGRDTGGKSTGSRTRQSI